MGHVSPTPSGKFRANWRDPSNKQKAKTFKTQKEAKAFLAEVESAKNHGTYIDPQVGKLLFAKHAEGWLAGRHVEVRTHERTLSVMRIHVLPQWGSWPLANIDHRAVQEWVNALSRKLAPASVAKCFGVLSMVMDSAIYARLIGINPCKGVSLPSTHKPRRPAQALSRADFFERLLPATVPNYRALVALAAGTGLRWGEAAGLAWGAVDLDAARVRVVQVVIESGGVRSIKPYPKSRAGVRSIPLPAFLVEELTQLRKSLDAPPRPTALLFTSRSGQPLLRSTFRRQVWRPALVRAGLLGSVAERPPRGWLASWPDAAGLEHTREFDGEREAVEHVVAHAAGGLHFHDLRHSYATWLVSDNVPVNIVRAVMGHESTSTTLNLYTHAPNEYHGRVTGVFDGPR
ncbi:tyrosine-type recombinase/integrase [Dactylosporangium sp. NPDC050588]|uniref:tyrosine-type recombinase/integrase n=1 Tax=Dactylosporangium sp. NPDC050588 TaxID=3157211 RepID=UPI0034075349